MPEDRYTGPTVADIAAAFAKLADDLDEQSGMFLRESGASRYLVGRADGAVMAALDVRQVLGELGLTTEAAS